MPPTNTLSPINIAHATLNVPGVHLTQPSTSEPVTALAMSTGYTSIDRGTEDLPRLLSTTDVAEWTGRCERTIRGWARAGLLQKRRIGRGTFYLAADVLALLYGSRDGGKTY